MELKSFKTKSICKEQIFADSKTRFNYMGKTAVCTKAVYENGLVKANVTVFDLAGKTGKAIFGIPTEAKVVSKELVLINDATLMVEKTATDTAEEAVVNAKVVRNDTDIRAESEF